MIISKSESTSRFGFTLIEIMVATAVMIILVGLVIQVTGQVLNIWNRSAGKLAAAAEARIALDFLSRDLETAVLRNDGQQWLRVETLNDPGGPFTAQAVVLKLFSPALDRDQSVAGDICAIGYELSYGPAYAGAADSIYALYRRIVDPVTTFNNLMGSPNDSGSPQLSLTGENWASTVGEEHYLASNIVEFKILLYEENGKSVANLVNAGEDTLLTPGSYSYGGTDSHGGTIIANRLLYADIILTVVSDDGMVQLERLENRGSGLGSNVAEEIVRNNGEVFIRRVYFPVQPI